MSLDVWFQCLRPKPEAKVRLIAFPYAGSGASIYRTWGDLFSREIEVVAVQMPGREGRIREKPYSRIEALLGPLMEAVKGKMTLPTAFFGHSMGACIAFELARALRRAGGPVPTKLLISGRAAPHLADRFQPMHALPENELIAEVAARYQPIPLAILKEREVLDLTLPTFRADLEMIELRSYVHEEPLATPISAYGGRHDKLVSEDDLRAWAKQTSAAFSATLYDGDHLYLNDQRLKPALVEAISAEIQ
jgi:surfactin synthase thioesterase subunit